MKITILGPAHPLRGGIATSNERLAREFINFGHEVELVSFSLQYPGFLFPGKTQYSPDPAPEDLKISTLINSVNPINWLSVGTKLKAAKPDIVIVRYWLPFMGPSLGTILKQIKKNKHTKVIALMDNVVPHEHRPGDKAFTQYFVNTCDAFVVMSKSVGEDLRQFTKTKPYRYSPHPIYDNYGERVAKNEARSFLKLDKSGKYLLFFGFVRKYKGLDLLLEAMADNRIKALGIKAIVAGEFYDKKEDYDAIVNKHSLQDNILFFDDFIPSEEVKYYFEAADLVVQPYKSATQSGISQIAYHFEKPMVVTDVGGLSEIVKHKESGYVVEVDVEAIADAIVDFYNQNRLKNFTAKVIEEKGRFAWSVMVNTMLELTNATK